MSHGTAASPRLTLRNALLVAGMCALMAGLGHASFVALRVFAMHKFSWATRDIIWMAPLSYAIFIIPATLLVFALNRLAPRIFSARIVLTVPLALAVFGMLLLVRVIHPLALLAFSLGVALQLSSWLVASLPASLVLARRIVVTLLVGVLAASLLIRGVPIIEESRAIARADPLPASAPNVLFIILDTVRASSMGIYGYARNNTPQLKRFAADGALFEWAIAPASWTLPSHASMFTGLDARAAGAGWKRSLERSATTIAEVLAEHGFVAAGFVANPHFTTWETGLAQGFHRWDDFDSSPQETFWASSLAQTTVVRDLVNAESWAARWTAVRRFDLRVQPEPEHERRSGAAIVDRFLKWQELLDSRRFFAFLNFYDAHTPYVSPPGWAHLYPTAPTGRDTYDSAIGYMDAELGRLFEALQARGILDQTIVIVSSDHGEQFGEHNLSLHGNSLYLNTIHVPLVIRYPRAVPAGTTVKTVVSLERIPATIMDLTAIERTPFVGASLRRSWDDVIAEGTTHAHSWIEKHPWGRPNEPATKGALTSVVDSSWHWIRNGDGGEELYRYREDAAEAIDRAPSSELGGVRAALRAAAQRQQLLR